MKIERFIFCTVMAFFICICSLPITNAEYDFQLDKSDYEQIWVDMEGDIIVFEEYHRGEGSQVILKNIKTGHRERLFPNLKSVSYPEINGDFVSCMSDSDIYVYDIKTNDIFELINNSAQQDPTSDGAKFVLWEQKDEIYVWNKQSNKITALTDNYYRDQSITADSGKAAWAGKENSVWNIFFADLETGKITKITDEKTEQNYPHMNEKYIVWQGLDPITEIWDIYAFNLSTGITIRITNDSYTQKYPFVDGDYVVFQDGRNGPYDIFMININTFEEIQITDSLSNEEMPKKSGNNVVWIDDRDGYDQIYYKILSSSEPGPENKKPPHVSIIGTSIGTDYVTISFSIYDENIDVDNVFCDLYKTSGGHIIKAVVEPKDGLYNDENELYDALIEISHFEKGVEYRVEITAIDLIGLMSKNSTEFIYNGSVQDPINNDDKNGIDGDNDSIGYQENKKEEEDSEGFPVTTTYIGSLFIIIVICIVALVIRTKKKSKGKI